MSILVKPYEISIWEDVWDSNNEKFVEKKLLTIGSHLMKSQNRVFNPNFVTNVNGTKKLSFQMYKQYRDDVTGEKVNNPFYPYLVNERKVKLKYRDEWHDFIIKNVSETSTNYLYSYQLEDAFVNELSKNGFNVELSAKEHTNLGTANELADKVLEGTDWSVSDESEAFVQKNEEALVYLKTTKKISCWKILDNEENYLTEGVDSEDTEIETGKIVLAFYSCCKDKPHRFQFIYPVTGLAVNDRRLITNKEYQYFIEYNNINNAYKTTNNGYQFVIPDDFNFAQDDSEEKTLVSSKYRAERYVYTPKTKYFSLLDKYMQEYKNTKDGITYYGYEQTDYIAPTLIANLIDNTEFTSTSGWVAGITADSEVKPIIENRYGRWDPEDNSFITIQDDWKAQNFSETIENQRKAYLYVTAGSKKDGETTTHYPGHVINSGFYSNRVSLGKITEGEKFILRLKMRNPSGGYIEDPANYLTPYLKNINYNTTNGYQILGATPYATFGEWEYDGKNNYCSCQLTIEAAAKNLTDKQFRNLKVKLGFSIFETSEFYIEDAQLFKYIPNETGYLTPSDQSTEAVINKTYKFYKESDLNTITSLDELPVENCISLDYDKYKPVYSSGAQKVRTIDAKESNYFNILQSIAEKFEAWLRIKVGHDSYGRPTTKEILFKNYVGKDNHAGFRYGVNLKGIERQNNAQQLATKLIVKNNQNEHAENKTCSISNAPSNESGENYLYNFDYYVTQGLLNARELDAYLYDDGAYVNDYWAKKFGENVNSGEVGYYTYLKFLNNFIQEKNEQLVPLQVSQNSLIASKTLAEEGKSAAIDELEAAYSNFEDIAQVSYPVFTGAIKEADPPQAIVECEIVASYSSEVKTENIDKLLCPEGVDWNGLNFNTDNTVHMMIWENDNFIPPPSNPNLALPLFENNQVVTTFAYQSPVAAVDTSYVAIAPSITASAGGALYNASMAYGFVNGNLSMISNIAPKARTFARTTTTTENESSTTNTWLGAKGSVSYEVPVGTSITGISINDVALESSEFTYDNGLLSIDLKWESWEALGMGQGVIGDRGTFNLTISLEKIVEYSEGSTKYEELVKREDIQELLQEITTLLSAKRTHNENFIDYEEKLDSLQLQINNLKAAIDSAITEKKIINQQFYAKYHRFIQEGTWVDEQYIDPELYYVDAQSVLYESCYPAITYTINLLELSQLEGYELYSYELGDKTFAEDEEFFGEEKRVEVIVTEISNKLDSPEQNTIKTQTYKNQFQDLFQKITATVQQAQYNTGAYKKAAGMVEASEARKQEYLEGAISDLATLLTNAGEATVEQTNTGIIIKEKGNSGNQLKLTGGALMFGQFDDETGEMTWKSGLSTKGMAAEMITSGKLNTGALQIMNGNEAVFRWDSLGISAFDYQTDANNNYTSRPNANKFVRFDKNGLYGINNPNISGVTWKPGSGDASAEEDIDANAAFKLTWDGLSLTPQNTTYTYKSKLTQKEATVGVPSINAKLGRVDNWVYNDWDINGFPTYDEEKAADDKNGDLNFVKVFAVGNKVGGHTSEEFVIYSDGTIGVNNIKLTGDIQWTPASSPSKNVYGKTNSSKPADGTLYNKFPDNDSAETIDNPETIVIENSPWHKIYNQEKDLYYCHTDDGGATWQGPFLITGQSIIDTNIEYGIFEAGLTVEELDSKTSGWSETLPEQEIVKGQALYIRIQDVYNNDTASAWRYMCNTPPISDLTLTASSLVVQEDQNGKLTPESITLTAVAQALSDTDGYYWTGVDKNDDETDNTTNTAIFTTDGMGDEHKITVEYAGVTDSLTIIKVKEGSDAISIVLTNPSMVFNVTDTSAVETTNVLVYRGSSSLPYKESTETSNGWYYTIQEQSNYAEVDEDSGVISVKNPTTPGPIDLTLVIYKGSNDISESKTISINCAMVSNNLRIALSNDKGIVVTDENGENGGYGDNVKTTATVYDGGETSSGWTFNASSSKTGEQADLLFVENPDGTFQITELKVDSAVLTITASNEDGHTLTTVFPVSRLKQGVTGTPARSYWLVSSSPIIAKKADGTYLTTSVTYTPMVQVGDEEPDIAEDATLYIYKDGISINSDGFQGAKSINLAESGADTHDVTNKLECKMYLDSIMVDEQTTEVLSNGVNIEEIKYAISDSQTNQPGDDDWDTYEVIKEELTQGDYLWTRIKYTNGDFSYSVTYISIDGASYVSWFKKAKTSPLCPDVGKEETAGWSKNAEGSASSEEYWYMIYRLSNENSYSGPIQVSGPQGAPGVDGNNIKFYYYRSKEEVKTLSKPTLDNSGNPTPSNWKDDAQGISDIYKYEYQCYSIISYAADGTPSYSECSDPILWAKWGEKGTDGAGIEYLFYLCGGNIAIPTSYDSADTGWTDEPMDPTEANPYVYVQKFKVTKDEDGNDDYTAVGSPALWTRYTKDGIGTKGDTVGVVTAYIQNNSKTFSSKPGTSSLGSDWNLQEMDPDESNKYVWSSTGNFTTSGSTTTYSNWTSPKLHAAWNNYDVNYKQYAEYLAATNFEQKETVQYGTDGKLYINASYINTGALTVKSDGLGANATGSEIFFAGLNKSGNPTVYLAGWTVNQNGLESASYYSDGTSSHSGISKRGSGPAFWAGVPHALNSNTWKDATFAVQHDGTLKAQAGIIGGMEIGQLVGRAEQVIGENLLLGTNLKYQNKDYPIHSYYTSTSDFNDGDWYTISFMANLGKANTSYPWYGIDIYNSGGTVILAHIPASDISIEQDKYYSIPFQWKKTSGAHSADNSYVSIYLICGEGYNDRLQLPESSIQNVKLEKGKIATEYCLANEEVNVNTNAFSWKFSPNEGMFMWNGPQGTISTDNPTGGAVFAIYNDGGTHKLSMKGHVEAESGEISGYIIDTNTLYSGDSTSTEKTFAGLSKYGTGPAFWAGATGSTSDDQEDSNFIVYHDGRAICKNIEARGGKIGPLTLSSSRLETFQSAATYSFSYSVTTNIKPKFLLTSAGTVNNFTAAVASYPIVENVTSTDRQYFSINGTLKQYYPRAASSGTPAAAITTSFYGKADSSLQINLNALPSGCIAVAVYRKANTGWFEPQGALVQVKKAINVSGNITVTLPYNERYWIYYYFNTVDNANSAVATINAITGTYQKALFSIDNHGFSGKINTEMTESFKPTSLLGIDSNGDLCLAKSCLGDVPSSSHFKSVLPLGEYGIAFGYVNLPDQKEGTYTVATGLSYVYSATVTARVLSSEDPRTPTMNISSSGMNSPSSGSFIIAWEYTGNQVKVGDAYYIAIGKI